LVTEVVQEATTLGAVVVVTGRVVVVAGRVVVVTGRVVVVAGASVVVVTGFAAVVVVGRVVVGVGVGAVVVVGFVATVVDGAGTLVVVGSDDGAARYSGPQVWTPTGSSSGSIAPAAKMTASEPARTPPATLRLRM
jgi:hypothetical protein